jgi:predicted RNA-binding Zn ribbon-like protein
MSGENHWIRDAPQPGGRPPAPGGLALVQAFLNTHYDLTAACGGEVLADPRTLRDWLASASLIGEHAPMRHPDLARALAVREGLRALAFANNGEEFDAAAVGAMRQASAGAGVEVRIEADGPRFIAASPVAVGSALGVLLAMTARAMIDGTWPRLKACPGRACGWVFYDHSKNQSARWCSMKVCGDREKARAYYQRQIEERAG